MASSKSEISIIMSLCLYFVLHKHIFYMAFKVKATGAGTIVGDVS